MRTHAAQVGSFFFFLPTTNTTTRQESNVHVVQAPVTVCGDIHGQFYDLLTLFKTGGEVEQGHSYIFMGDFVDRGFNSLETFTLLMLLKARWPDRITLLRGNHESRQVTVIYGFWDECNRKYGSPDAWRSCTDVFDCLNIAALVEGRVFCLHGGLSPLARSIDVMRCIQRKQEIPTEGLFCDLMWSDPDEQVDTWSGSPRGAGWLFGQRVTQEFNRINKLSLVCRAHQLVQDGYKYAFSVCARVGVVWWECGRVCAEHVGGEKRTCCVCLF